VVTALAVLAPDPCTKPGQFFLCRVHQEMVIWDGRRWRWSNQPEDIAALPSMAGSADDAGLEDS
jgi:hypothetical protein